MLAGTGACTGGRAGADAKSCVKMSWLVLSSRKRPVGVSTALRPTMVLTVRWCMSSMRMRQFCESATR